MRLNIAVFTLLLFAPIAFAMGEPSPPQPSGEHPGPPPGDDGGPRPLPPGASNGPPPPPPTHREMPPPLTGDAPRMHPAKEYEDSDASRR